MMGMQQTNWLLSAIACLAVCVSIAFAKPVEIKLQDGIVWQGEIGQTITVIYEERKERIELTGEFTLAGSTYIELNGEIISLMTIISISSADDPQDSEEETVTEIVPSTSSEPTMNTRPKPKRHVNNADNAEIPNYFWILPMEKGVGSYFRPSELIDLAAYLDDNYGPGQTIVLKVNSGGGYGYIWAKCRDAIFDIRKRHRVVAWISINATSAAAMTVYCCDEIYYDSMGHVGSCTGYRGNPNNVMPPDEMQGMITDVEKCIVQSSRPVQLAGCLFEAWRMLAYTKDPVTGAYTYYDENDDIPGNATMLSDNMHNLNLGAQEAVDAGLADGIADTEAQLAELLDIQDWVENEDRYGIELFEAWDKTMTSFEEEVWPDLIERFVQGQIEGETEKQILSKRIKAGKELLRWTRKLGDSWTYQYAILEFPRYVGKQFSTAADATDYIHRMIAELQHRLRLVEDD